LVATFPQWVAERSDAAGGTSARKKDSRAHSYQPLGLAEARPPPYFRSVTRLKPTSQVELFE
jgi:hypothetical protein